MTARRYRGLAVAGVLVAAFLTACSSSTTTGTSTSTATSTASTSTGSKSAICTDVANLKTSVQDLRNTNVRANGLSALTDQLEKIQQQLTTLKTSAKGQYSTQITDLSNALSGLSSSLNAAKSDVNAGTLGAVATAAHAVVTAGNNLVTAVSNTC